LVDGPIVLEARAKLERTGTEGPGRGDAGDDVELRRSEHLEPGPLAIGEHVDVDGNRELAAEDVDVAVGGVPKEREAAVVGARGVRRVVDRGAERERTADVEPAVPVVTYLTSVRAPLLVEPAARRRKEDDASEDRARPLGLVCHPAYDPYHAGLTFVRDNR
jgi:hypothetical protein